MESRYKQIAQHLAEGIRKGTLGPGERLPSLRSLCLSRGTSLMTALAAYRHLEDLGLVEALPRSGYRVAQGKAATLCGPAIPRPRVMPEGGHRSDILAQVLASLENPSSTPLGFGCPSPDLFPQASLRRLTASLLNTRKNLWAGYSAPPGCAELRRQIALRLQRRGMEVGPEDVLITTGAMEALTLSVRLLTRPGDLVALECPTFFGIVDAVRNAGARILELPGDPQGGVEPGRLLAACDRHPVTAAVLIPSFANPTGSLMGDDRRRAWMEALQARGVALVEDDLYGELAWDHRRPTPLCAWERSDGLPNLLVGSLSKTLLPGGRVGYVVARGPWIERLTNLKATSTLANATLPEHLAAECLSSGLFDRHLRRMVPRLQAGVHALRASIARHFPQGTHVSDPRGGYLLWVELPKGVDGLTLFRLALQQGVTIAPGCLFSQGPGLERFIRLNGGLTCDLDGPMATLGRLVSELQDRGG